MEEKVYILFDRDTEYRFEMIVGVCKTLEEAQRGVNYFLLSGREGVTFEEATFSSFDGAPEQLFYEHEIYCELRGNILGCTSGHFVGYKKEKEKGQISWSSKREYDGTKKFEVRLRLILDRPSLGFPISKPDRKMIAEQIELLSDGKIECKVPYVDFDL